MPKNRKKVPLTDMQYTVLQTLRTHGPLTDEQLSRKLSQYPGSTVRTRRSELVAKNKVRAHSERTNARGRHVTVWKAAYSRSM